MKPLTLYPHELRRLLPAGRVTLWRPVEPQPVGSPYWTECDGAFYPALRPQTGA